MCVWGGGGGLEGGGGGELPIRRDGQGIRRLRLEIYHYPPEVSSMKYCCWGVLRKEYLRLVTR